MEYLIMELRVAIKITDLKCALNKADKKEKKEIELEIAEFKNDYDYLTKKILKN